MSPRYLVFILVLLSHAGTVRADAGTAGESAVYQPLAAHYLETRSVRGAPKASAEWFFTRQENRVETARGDYAEMWQRDERGELSLTRVFHRDRKLIQYTPGELRTQGRQKDWHVLNTLIDPRRIAALKRTGTVSFLGRPASRYAGRTNGERTEVTWLDKEALAAKLVRAGRDGSVSLELRELRSSPDSRWPQANLAKADSYAYLDGADLGDMEYDPFVQRVLGEDGGHAGHVH